MKLAVINECEYFFRRYSLDEKLDLYFIKSNGSTFRRFTNLNSLTKKSTL